MKKSSGLVLLLLTFLLLPLAVAQISVPYDSNYNFLMDGSQKFIDAGLKVTAPFFSLLLGDYTGNLGDFSLGEIFFIRAFLLIVLFALIYSVLKTTPKIRENNAIVFIIAAAASIMSVRFMSKSDMIIGILLPYGALGVAITTLLPFIIFFYFLHSTEIHGFGRKIGWGFFFIVLISIWVSRYNQLSDITRWIYIATFIAIIVALFFDKEIHRYFALYNMHIFMTKSKQKAIANLQAEYYTLSQVSPQSSEIKQRLADVAEHIQKLGGSI